MVKVASTLYDAKTGLSLGKVDAGEGARQKSWLEEVSSWLLQASAEPNNVDIIQVNYPEFLTGYGRHAKPIGNNTPGQLPPSATGGFKGISVYKVVPKSGLTAASGTGTGPYTATLGRTLPFTVQVLDGAVLEGTDNGLGGFLNSSGTGVTAGAINYTTGGITSMSFSADPGGDLTFSVSTLVALTLSDPVRIPAGGMNFAISANY